MNFTTTLIGILLFSFLSVFQLDAQRDPFDPGGEEPPCASLTNVKQECQDDNTVTVTFQIAISGKCSPTGVTIIGEDDFHQTYPIVSNGVTESSSTITYTGATPGTSLTFDVIVLGEGQRECCRIVISIDVMSCSCDLEASLIDLSCGPNGWARVYLTGGTKPYSGPAGSIEVGQEGNFIIQPLDFGTHTLKFRDAEGCEVEVTFYMPECGCEHLNAQINSLTCGPDATAVVYITGGTQPYTGPSGSFEAGTAGNFVIQGLDSGPHTLRFVDADGCEIEVSFVITDTDLEASLVEFSCAPDSWARINVTGGTQPYSGPSESSEVDAPGNFIVENLDSGPQYLTFTDADGCSVTVPFNIPDALAITAFSSSSGCDDGSMEITIANGVPPYYGPGNQQSNTGEFAYEGLTFGDYEWSFFDSNGCEIVKSFTIELNNPEQYSTCADFEEINFVVEGQDSDFMFTETHLSLISAVLHVQFTGQLIPDQFIMTINDNEVANWIVGTHECNTDVNCWNAEGYFCIEPCDEVTFEVIGNSCDLGGTTFALRVFCEEGECPTPAPDPGPNCWTPLNGDEVVSSRSRSEVVHKTKVEERSTYKFSPNPVTNEINISFSGSLMDYQSIRIIDANGRVVHTESTSNKAALRIDAMHLSEGIYFLEIIDAQGHKSVEKFIKI